MRTINSPHSFNHSDFIDNSFVKINVACINIESTLITFLPSVSNKGLMDFGICIIYFHHSIVQSLKLKLDGFSSIPNSKSSSPCNKVPQ